GPQGGDTHDYNPVDLNSLLFRMEMDMAEIHRELARGGDRSNHLRAARRGEKRAQKRRELVTRTTGDARACRCSAYDVPSGRRGRYGFATTFTPLATGLATPEQACQLLTRALPRFEAPWGLRTSLSDSGHRWDGDIGWAPLIEDAVA